MTDTIVEPAAVLTPARQLPWQGISSGEAGDELLTSATLAARAGIDWEVGLRPYMRQTAAGLVPSTKMFETYRLDTDDQVGVVELGGVKSRYELLQNREAFDFGDSLVTDGIARWTHGGMQGTGRRVFMTMLLNEEFTVLGQNAMKVYLFFSTSHDGSRSLMAAVTPVNVFCTNQTAIVRANNFGRFTIQHTSSMQGKLQQAGDAIREAGEYSELLKTEAEALAAVKISDDKARYLLASVIPTRRARRDEMIGGIMANYHTSPNLADYQETGWGLLNGLTEYMDHIKPSRSGNARFESITLGEGAKYRVSLAQALVEMN